jgi:hypothetical protein
MAKTTKTKNTDFFISYSFGLLLVTKIFGTTIYIKKLVFLWIVASFTGDSSGLSLECDQKKPPFESRWVASLYFDFSFLTWLKPFLPAQLESGSPS